MHIATEVLGRDSRGFLYRANKQEIDIKTKNLGGKQKYFCSPKPIVTGLDIMNNKNIRVSKDI